MKTIKVVHICSSLEGGAGLCAKRIMHSTSILGIDNYVLVKDGTENDYTDIIKRKESKCIILFYLRKILHHFHMWPEASRINYRIKKAILQHDISGLFTSPVTEYRISEHNWIAEADIIHIHWVGGFLDYKSFFKNVNKPIVWTMHDENPGFGGFHYSMWKKMSTHKGQQIDDSMALIKKKAYSHVKSMHVVAISSIMKDFICNNDLLKGFPCTLIHNGIDHNLFIPINKDVARKALGISNNRLVFMFTAYNIYDERKGLEVLLNALNKLNIPDTTLICLGHYDKKPQTAYEVRCEGLITNPRLMSLFYSAADFFVMPSYQESFAQTPLESMACGTPVIAFPCGIIPEIISPANGVVCSDFSFEALVKAIQEVSNRHYDRDVIRRFVVENFSYNNIASQYVQLYEKILNMKN